MKRLSVLFFRTFSGKSFFRLSSAQKLEKVFPLSFLFLNKCFRIGVIAGACRRHLLLFGGGFIKTKKFSTWNEKFFRRTAWWCDFHAGKSLWWFSFSSAVVYDGSLHQHLSADSHDACVDAVPSDELEDLKISSSSCTFASGLQVGSWIFKPEFSLLLSLPYGGEFKGQVGIFLFDWCRLFMCDNWQLSINKSVYGQSCSVPGKGRKEAAHAHHPDLLNFSPLHPIVDCVFYDTRCWFYSQYVIKLSCLPWQMTACSGCKRRK